VSRAEFSKPVKREALKRSGGLCEASGPMYGIRLFAVCGNQLSYGVEFDHIVLDANSKDNSLENCAAVCVKCHRWKTTKHDTPMAAKTVRQQDKLGLGIRKRSSFPKPPPGVRFDWKQRRYVREAT
jgi:5-methylcytosine-specific restriction endonuclease McrA